MGFGAEEGTSVAVDNVDWSGLVGVKDGHTTACKAFDVDVQEA